MALVASSPLGSGSLPEHRVLEEVAREHDVSSAQIALAWVIRHDGVFTIPKAATAEHVEANVAAANIELSADQLERLDRAFFRGRDRGGVLSLWRGVRCV